MEALKRTIDSFKEMLDTFQCPHPLYGETYNLKDLTGIEWSCNILNRSCYTFEWTENGSIRDIYYPLRRGSREMYVTNTHILLAEVRTIKYHRIHYYIVLDRSKEVKKEGAHA